MLQLPRCKSQISHDKYSYASGLGYFKDPYCSLFLKTKKKMYPIINRGTWARVFSFRSVIKKFLEAYKDDPEGVNIMSLGAGYDTTFFWI